MKRCLCVIDDGYYYDCDRDYDCDGGQMYLDHRENEYQNGNASDENGHDHVHVHDFHVCVNAQSFFDGDDLHRLLYF